MSDVTANGGSGTVVDAKGDNANVSGVDMSNHEGTGVSTDGAGSSVSDVTANGGSGTVVDVKGANATVSGVTVDKHDGTPIVAPSDANVTPAKVTKYGTAIVAGAKSYVISYGGKYSVVFSPKVAGKTIVLVINNQKLTAVTDANGVATFTLTKALLKSAGVKTVSLSFAEDSLYYGAVASAKITVNKEKSKIAVKSVKKTYKKSKSKKIKITLKNSKNKVIKGTFKVSLKVNKKLKGSVGKKLKKGYTFKVKFNKKGIGYITLKNSKVKGFKKGTYKFTVSYKGSGVYKSATKKNIKMKIKN